MIIFYIYLGYIRFINTNSLVLTLLNVATRKFTYVAPITFLLGNAILDHLVLWLRAKTFTCSRSVSVWH